LDQNTDADAGARYAAIKALGFRGEVTSALARLRAAWENETEDLRIRLEALAGLSRRAPEAWLPVLAEFRKTLEPDMAMEAVFILAELPLPLAVEVLAALVADRNLPDELRAAAAWGLGVGGHHRPELLLDHFEDSSDDVALHSLVAIGSELSETALEHVADRIQNGERAAAAAVAVLSRHGVFGARVLLRRVESFRSARANAWVLVGLGLLGRQTVQAAAGDPLPADFSHSLEPVWIGLTESWILGERASSRDFLSRQTVRERIAT
jgi:HEAT repeat protein